MAVLHPHAETGNGKTLIVERSLEDVEREFLARLRRFEVRYEMTSEDMAGRQEAGTWPETRDIAEWMFYYRALLTLKGG